MCERPNGQIATEYIYRIAIGDQEVVHSSFYFRIVRLQLTTTGKQQISTNNNTTYTTID